MSAQIPRSFGDISFHLPEAYSMNALPDGAIMEFLDENKNHYMMFLLPPAPFTGNVQQDFADSWNNVYGTFSRPVTAMPMLVKKKHTKGWDYYEGGTQCRHTKGKLFYAWHSMHIAGNKIVAFSSAAQDETRFGYNRIFTNQVLHTLDFKFYKSNHPLAGNGKIKGNSITGVWQGIRSAMFRDGSVGRAVEYLVFYDDGVFCKEMPACGLDSIDRAGSEENRKGFWGTYNLNIGNGTASYSSYKNEPLRLANNILHFNNSEFEKLASIDGAVFEGVYTSKKDRQEWWRGYEPTVRFTKDGRFDDNSALFDVDEKAGLTAPTQKPGKGKYICRNFSMILLYDDGRKAQIAFYSYDRNGSVSPVHIGLAKGPLYKK